jgi:hypothetical protein
MSNSNDTSIDDSVEELLDEPSEVTESSIMESSDILENTSSTTELDELSEVTESYIQENSDILENAISTTELDELTLSLLMNKTQYRKYIAQTDPDKSEVDHRIIKDNRQYRNKILDITKRMIDTPDIQITTDVEKIFIAYTKTLVQYFQMKELEQQPEYNNGYYGSNDDTDDDVLFGSIDGTTPGPSPTTSFWGKERVVKHGKSTISNCDMRMFSKR